MGPGGCFQGWIVSVGEEEFVFEVFFGYLGKNGVDLAEFVEIRLKQRGDVLLGKVV